MNEPSGAQWCARFPTSANLADLAEPFRSKAIAFINALRGAGAAVTVSATYRPVERAYLMHWCCMIAKSGQDPALVPPMPGVAIDWTHGGNRAEAAAAARAMKAGYRIQFPAALTSRHTQRRAIDMGLSVPAGARIFDKTGQLHFFDKACTGEDPRVIAIGKTFGVIKLVNDPPHWSDDGR